MMLAEVPVVPPTPATLSSWLECLVWLLAAIYLGFLVYGKLKGKPALPTNEVLESSHYALNVRTSKNENSIRTLYTQVGELRENFPKQMAAIKEDFTEQLHEQTAAINAAGERRQAIISEQFQTIAASLARLDERSKHNHD